MTDQLPTDWGDPTWGAPPDRAARDARSAGSQPQATGATGATATSPPPPSGPPGRRPGGPTPSGPRPQPRQRKKRRGLLSMVVLLVLAVLCAIAVVFAFFVIWVVSMSRAPIEATNTFLADLDEGRIETAYDSLCAESRGRYTIEEFTDRMSAADRITGYTFISSALRSSGETVVSGTIEVDESPRSADFGLIEEAGAWRVCSFDPIE